MPRLGVSITRDVIHDYFTTKIMNELDSYLNKIDDEWGDKYDLNLEYLKNKYNYNWVEVHVDKLNTKKIKKEKDAAKQRYYERMHEDELNTDTRCCARIWSFPPFVFYDKENGKWILGEQCSRKQKKDGLCGIHLRNLPHGKMNEKPPHNKFQKYQKRVAAKN